jgi:hypothetical protein
MASKDLDLDKYLLTPGSIFPQFSKMEDLYTDIYVDGVKSNHPMDLYRYIDLQMNPEYVVYTISDLHADVRRFLAVLVLGDFIDSDVDMLNPLLNLQWNPEMKNTILVICGDIIDGRRPPRENTRQTYCDELVIHMLIYNLRILARKYNSYVFCTLGNHDFFAFHSSPTISANLAYRDYIDSSSRTFYSLQFYSLLQKNVVPQVSEYVTAMLSETDSIYFARAHILSRFYLIGFQPFLKINNTLFAHAGFHLESNILNLFEESRLNTQTLQPHAIHRLLLEQLADPMVIFNFFTQCAGQDFPDLAYSQFYDSFLVGLRESELPLRNIVPNSELAVDKYENMGTEIRSETSMFYNLFLTRELQRNCVKVDQLLALYGCNSLVVGHCPTCTFGVFDPEDIIGINDCSDARIVYSCASKLVTVDIAMSTGFSPEREFLEMLRIKNVGGEQEICTVRMIFETALKGVYNKKRFDGTQWVPIKAVNPVKP